MRGPLLALALLLAACGGDSDSTGTGTRADTPLAPTTRDSAGIAIHEHPADALERAPLITIDSVPLAVIGDANNVELDLSRSGRPVFLSDGQLALFASGSVWIFDADGNEIERIGRPGAGPQEFGAGSLAPGLGDTIVVTDGRNSRLALVVPGAGVARVRTAMLRSDGKFYGAAGQLGDDAFLMINQGSALTPDGESKRLDTPTGRLDPGVDSVRDIIPLQGQMVIMHRGGAGGGGIGIEQYSPMDIATWWRGEVLVVRGDRWAVERYDAEGGLQSRTLVPRPRLPITEEMKREDIDAQIASFKQSMGASLQAEDIDTAQVWAEVRGQPFADSLTHFRGVSTTRDGLAWLQAATRMSDSTWHYTALRPDGRIVGVLRGEGRTPVALSDDRAILRMEDDDGIVTWQVHRLVMPGGGAGGVNR
jgi:hypothetical protein